jgi:hypothetical protein
MRPVVKGPAPRQDYARYQDALDDLAARLGLYCSYCEQPIQHAPEVEHVQPKSVVAHLEKSWENFLLACKSCNTIKGNDPVDLDQFAFPDSDNTFLGLVFRKGGWVELSADLDPAASNLMSNVVGIVKLRRHPLSTIEDGRPSPRDKRAEFRNETWILAERMLERYQTEPSVADLITQTIAPLRGFFSVWMTVFRDHPDMLKSFIEAFPGTDVNCFDANGSAIPRPDGRI